MMRKPIFTGIAAVLALALMGGLAYGAGHLVATRDHAYQGAQQGPRIVVVQPGFHGFNGTAFRHQTRQWMQDRFTSFRRRMNLAGHGGSWGRHDGRNGWMNRGTIHRSNGYPHSSGYQNGSSGYSGNGYEHHSGYHHRDQWGSGSWGGGSYGGWGGGSNNNGGYCGR